jgi:hypothetical protein
LSVVPCAVGDASRQTKLLFERAGCRKKGQLLHTLQAQDTCHISGCKHDVPAALAELKVCILHFTLSLEASCAEMRRETALGNAPQDRQREILKFITSNGEALARVATSGLHLTDDLKARVLSTFLTLMNLREYIWRRANERSRGLSCPSELPGRR